MTKQNKNLLAGALFALAAVWGIKNYIDYRKSMNYLAGK